MSFEVPGGNIWVENGLKKNKQARSEEAIANLQIMRDGD